MERRKVGREEVDGCCSRGSALATDRSSLEHECHASRYEGKLAALSQNGERGWAMTWRQTLIQRQLLSRYGMEAAMARKAYSPRQPANVSGRNGERRVQL